MRIDPSLKIYLSRRKRIGGDDDIKHSELLKAYKVEIEKLFKKYPLINNPRIFGLLARSEDTPSFNMPWALARAFV